MNTQELRDSFLVSGLYQPGLVRGQFTDLDRLVLGGVMPTGAPVREHLPPATKATPREKRTRELLRRARRGSLVSVREVKADPEAKARRRGCISLLQSNKKG